MSTGPDPRSLAARLLAATRCALPLASALGRIRLRRERLLAPTPAPAASPSQPDPVPVLDDADAYGRDFWKNRKAGAKKPAKTSKPKRPGRPTETPSPFRIIDGDRDKD